MLGKVFKAYDVRATYPNPLNEQTAWKIGYGAARYLFEKAQAIGRIDPMMRYLVVGRDMRKSSPSLTQSLMEGIRAYGGHVIDVGLVDTPFVYFAINYLECAGGIQTTASHNPAEYNGFKISGLHALPIGMTTGLDEISKYAAMADFEKTQNIPPPIGRVEPRDLWGGYREHVLSFLDLPSGRSAVKVVVDASNGMAGTMLPKVFEGVKGLKIVPMNFDNSSGTFVHEPNPLNPANLVGLQARVVKEKADFGACFDGDADRCIFLDEKGKVIGCDHLTALLAKDFLKANPGAGVVYDLRSSRAISEEITAAGGKPVESRVGHVFMKQKMREHRAVFGGELSGHFYFRDNFNADSGAIAFARLASLVAHARPKLSAMIAPLARYAQSGEINFINEQKEEALANLEARYMDQGKISHLDGVTVDCWSKHGWWCNVRQSNTEPLLRLNLEARNAVICDRVVNEISPLLGQRAAH